MSYIGLLVWVFFSLFIVGTFLWSTTILLQQKNAWEKFAKKNNLTFVKGKFFRSPAISGVMGNYRIAFFTDGQKTNDMRAQRYVTVLEIQAQYNMPAPAAIATKEFSEFINALNMPQIVDMTGAESWDTSYIVRARDSSALKPYLTPQRIKTLSSLFSMKNAAAIFFFDTQECVLRIEATDPLRNDVHMEKIVKRLFDTMEKLKP